MVMDEIAERLHQAGHKVTPQRLTIIQIITESDELLTPSALFKKVREVDPEVGEVTVYRTLDILSELGLVCMIHTGENTHSYVGRPPEHHGHLICSGCGKVVNFTQCNVARLEKRLVSETGFDIDDHRLEFFGKCRECKGLAKSL
jgi:Fur family ferric uptake transcriptional regulator